MGRLKNITGDALSVPALGFPGAPRQVEAGEVVDWPDEVPLPDQAQLAPVADDEQTKAELQASLAAQGLATTGTKAELLERLPAAQAQPGEGE